MKLAPLVLVFAASLSTAGELVLFDCLVIHPW